MNLNQVTVLGAGSWGTALAVQLARNGYQTVLWGKDPDKIEAMRLERRNTKYLPQVDFPDNLILMHDLESAVKDSDCLVLAVPSFAFAETLCMLGPLVKSGIPVICATKGLDNQGHAFFHELVTRLLGRHHSFGLLAGPSFAQEVANNVPTFVMAVSEDLHLRKEMQQMFASRYFRVHQGSDVIGVELCGVFKNILAIACGLVDGQNMGANTRCGLIALGLAEAAKLGRAMGAKNETFSGLAGVGDFLLSCTDDQSRNRRFGLALAEGYNKQQAYEAVGQVVEGVHQLAFIIELASSRQIELPITQALSHVIHDGGSSGILIDALCERASLAAAS